jgi:hypothetical protein
VSTFGSVPDAPVSGFDLTINGGSKGILVVTGQHENICKAPQTSNVVFGAHSGKGASYNITMSKPCTGATHAKKGKKGKKKK